MGFSDEIKSRNFSIYAQWFGIFSMILSLILGFSNLFHIGVIVVFGVLSMIMGLLLSFVEIPYLLKMCPTSQKFNSFVEYFNHNWPRAGLYAVFSVTLFFSGIVKWTSLIVPALFMVITCLCYTIAALQGKAFMSSSIFGGTGVSQTI
ncbi:hypothetical protein T552_03306 [Pneumocystis carinii B80]|uniref:Golgi apparatus membrane protein TVP18 n=1 Tax=Pneumocystis carinii (strain B80) TaxID=1408658 RepID=A0A0W4ZBQ3_PNEC8|nr:hypothetical protein T552_03306 [Pneumocystis carinii B80]KTW25694.1 hypothetical protein T552_03306 [Pneumocystis carinii B80]